MTKPNAFKRKPGPRTERLLGPISPRTVGLDDLTVTKALVLGKDNLSQGLREAVRVAYDRYQRTPDVTPSTTTDAQPAPPAAPIPPP